MSDIGYSEKDFEKHIFSIPTSKNGYIHGDNNNNYNTQKSILPEIFISFVKPTQTDNWICLCEYLFQIWKNKILFEIISITNFQLSTMA